MCGRYDLSDNPAAIKAKFKVPIAPVFSPNPDLRPTDTAPVVRHSRAGEREAVGKNDNSWCSDPQAVVDVMAQVKKPWIAFKILAAGAIHPRLAFPQAVNSGADFILVGMFDWQVAEDVDLASRVFRVSRAGSGKRRRPWYS